MSADVDGFLRAVDSFWEGLAVLGRVLEMPILSEEHLEIRRLAEGCGVRYKPSGAGGGDLGIAVSNDLEALREFRARTGAAGYGSPALAPDAMGLHVGGM